MFNTNFFVGWVFIRPRKFLFILKPMVIYFKSLLLLLYYCVLLCIIVYYYYYLEQIKRGPTLGAN